MPSDTQPCSCDWPKRAVTNEWFPITYDDEMREYHLVLDCGERGKGTARLRYCPWCGDALPKSARGTFFTVPTQSDRAAVQETLSSVKTVADMYETLGEPTDCIEGDGRNQYTYDNLWDSLNLVVFEYKQEIGYTFHGKEKQRGT